MIEVEQKFLVDRDQLENLLKTVRFIKEFSFVDTYYDTPDYALSKDDIWLRQRDRAWELKVPLDGQKKDYLTNQYEEIVADEQIRQFLQIDSKQDLAQALLLYNYRPFCELKTVRRKYQQGEFNIDVDVVSGENFNYALIEVELLVDSSADVEIAKTKILTWAKEHGLAVKSVFGKVILYLQQQRPQHFQALVNSGTIKIN